MGEGVCGVKEESGSEWNVPSSEGKEILPFIGLQVMFQVFSLRLGVRSSLCYTLNHLLIQSPSF